MTVAAWALAALSATIPNASGTRACRFVKFFFVFVCFPAFALNETRAAKVGDVVFMLWIVVDWFFRSPPQPVDEAEGSWLNESFKNLTFMVMGFKGIHPDF